jgi:hypothetical protein
MKLRRAGMLLALVLTASTGIGGAVASAASTQDRPRDAPSSRVQAAVEQTQALFAHRGATAQGFRALTSGHANDPVGDADDARGDITRIGASYSASELRLTMNLDQPSDPRTDPLWQGTSNEFAAMSWGIDVTGDGLPDYDAVLTGGEGGTIAAFVIPLSGSTAGLLAAQPCPGVRGHFASNTYAITMPAMCVGSAPHLWFAGVMLIESGTVQNPTFSFDSAPDDLSSLLGPLNGPSGGYLLGAADGGAFAYGTVQFHGSLGALHLSRPIVDIAATAGVQGYTMLGADGGVFTFGNAGFHGSAASLPSNSRFAALALTPSGQGYWLVTVTGAVFAYGDAQYLGAPSQLGTPSSPVVDIISSVDGDGYWIVTANGGVFGFGDAPFLGSAASLHLNQPIVAIASTPDGQGYWLVGRDGGIFSYGNAPFFGSTGGIALTKPIVGMLPTTTNRGYRMVAADGGIFSFGDAPFLGSAANLALHQPIVGLLAN